MPESAFVFCCFNNPSKISPAMFDVWMRLMSRVPGSVLWLLETNAFTSDNLRREARARGVDQDRLVFAPRARPAAHLARYGIADIFLDTLPYNAHTTASDALWMGLPVLTCLGETFPGRVAASILRAHDCPDLITHSLDAYEQLAFQLATDPQLLAPVKARLSNPRVSRLFDSRRFAREIESAYRTVINRLRSGMPPAAFRVGVID